MFSLLMNSPHFSTHDLKRSGIPHIALSGISAEKQHQADREFAMRAAFDIARSILSTLSTLSGRIFTAALLEACSPFDALSPTLPSPSTLLHVEVRRDSFAAGHDTDVGNA